ncbi:MAG: BamA/TamA family outer membrane protein [Gemmatimonadales bacterium]
MAWAKGAGGPGSAARPTVTSCRSRSSRSPRARRAGPRSCSSRIIAIISRPADRGVRLRGTVPCRLGWACRFERPRAIGARERPGLPVPNQDAWRPNPLIDDGHFQTPKALAYDSRNDVRRPTSGWHIQAARRAGRSDDASPLSLPTAVREPIPPGRFEFEKATFDIRRYARFNPGSRVAARITGAGWIGGDPLPVQQRVSLGGPDILPGYGFRALTCSPPGFNEQVKAALCDRMLAAQLEVRTALPVSTPFRFRNADLLTIQQILGIEQADLVLFADAGKAWLTGDGPGRVPNNRIPKFGEWSADFGAGLDLGGIGIYAAKALSDDEAIRIVLRLERRF